VLSLADADTELDSTSCDVILQPPGGTKLFPSFTSPPPSVSSESLVLSCVLSDASLSVADTEGPDGSVRRFLPSRILYASAASEICRNHVFLSADDVATIS